jgi:hypothetical protein
MTVPGWLTSSCELRNPTGRMKNEENGTRVPRGTTPPDPQNIEVTDTEDITPKSNAIQILYKNIKVLSNIDR